MCPIAGLFTMGMSGFGVVSVSGRSLVPSPPARITAFIIWQFFLLLKKPCTKNLESMLIPMRSFIYPVAGLPDSERSDINHQCGGSLSNPITNRFRIPGLKDLLPHMPIWRCHLPPVLKQNFRLSAFQGLEFPAFQNAFCATITWCWRCRVSSYDTIFHLIPQHCCDCVALNA